MDHLRGDIVPLFGVHETRAISTWPQSPMKRDSAEFERSQTITPGFLDARGHRRVWRTNLPSPG